MDAHPFDVLGVRGSQEESGDGSGKAEGTNHLPHGFLARRGHRRPQGLGVGTGNGTGDFHEVEAITDQVGDVDGKLGRLVVAARHDRRVHTPVVGDDVLEVVVGHEENLELTVGHGQRHERQVAEVPSFLLGGKLGEERTVAVGQLQVAQVHALQGRQERDRGGRRAPDLDDAGGRGFHGLGRVLVRGPDPPEG